MTKVIQISFTEGEFEHLERRAEEEGSSVALYIKNRVLEDTEFQKCFGELLTRVSRIKVGTKFNIKAVFGTDWTNITKGVRLAMGRAFYNYVKAGKVSNITALPNKDSANTQWYKVI